MSYFAGLMLKHTVRLNPITILCVMILVLSGCASTKQELQTETLVNQMLALQLQIQEQNNSIANIHSSISEVQTKLVSINKKVVKTLKTSKAAKTAVEQKIKLKTLTCKSDNKITPKDGDKVIVRENKIIIGSQEWFYLPLINEYFKARVDSGAATSSINAKNIKRFERNGKKWVRFDIMHSDGNVVATLERPLERRVAIKQATSEEKESRLVISLMIKMGDISENTEFTLVDRTHMEHSVLLGRSFIKDLVLVDVSKQFSQKKYVPSPEPTNETIETIETTKDDTKVMKTTL